ASPTGYAITTPPRKPCAEQPPAPTNNYTDRCSQVRNFGEHSRGFSMSAVTVRPRDRNCHLIVQQTHFLIELGTGLFGRCTVLA
ncbi:hypothetical protein, partial [Mycolicibacterium sp. J2]|uniref:hypothetical protein n=1 Tax=Mycolicibacterium sp. J2 TaxID=2993511 RepID=UPI00224AD8E8